MDDVTKVQLAAGARQLALVVGGWAIGRGYLEADTVTMLATSAAIIVPTWLGQRSTRKLAKSDAK